MQRIKTIAKLFVLLLLSYLLLRLIFYAVYFAPLQQDFSATMAVFYWGERLDIAGLFYINVPFLGYYFFLAGFLPKRFSQIISLVFFSAINLFFIAINTIDLVYFKYNLRRSTVDLLYSFTGSVHSFGGLFRQYWFVLLGFILFCIAFIYLAKRILYNNEDAGRERWYLSWLTGVCSLAILFFIARGWDKRPIVPSTALLHADATVQPLVNNSTLNILYSWLRATSRLERKNYFTAAQLDALYSIRRQYPSTAGFTKKNVVVFVLESFSADFLLDGPLRARTPFFDSLRNRSIVCTNAFANGHESVMGMTAILGSLPPFTDEPFFISNYSSVPFRGIGTLLKEEGYTTDFFMGAEYDHFNFAKLCRMTGIDHYYSKDTYGRPEHDDGNWGIYDGFFFPYFAGKMATEKQPFFSVLFNISSHPPFAIPASQRTAFTIPGQTAQQNSISYVDHCFSELFQQLRQQPWFNNTLFVFCADHTLLDYSEQPSYQYHAYHIPLFFYEPQDTAGRVVTKPVQQLDIVPTILDQLHYAKPFMSFGHSFLRNDRSFSISRKNGLYQVIDSCCMTGFDEHHDKIIYRYNYVADSSFTRNLYQTVDPDSKATDTLIKVIIQRFNNSLLDQQLLIGK